MISLIEMLAKLYAEIGGQLGLFLFGYFMFAFMVVLIFAYVLLKILACIHDNVAMKYKLGIYPERRRGGFRHVKKYGLITRIVRRIRKADD